MDFSVLKPENDPLTRSHPKSQIIFSFRPTLMLSRKGQLYYALEDLIRIAGT